MNAVAEYDGSVIVITACTLAIFAGFAMAVAHAFFSKTPSGTGYRMVLFWTGLLALTTIGCQIVSDFVGITPAAAIIVLALLVGSCSSWALARHWETADALKAVSHLQMQQASHRRENPIDNGVQAEHETITKVSIDHAVGCDEEARSGKTREAFFEYGSDSDSAIVCAMAARSYDLTRREEEVLRLLLDGKSFAAIAGELFISDNTVKTHVRHIYRKMGVNRKEGLSEKVFAAAPTEVL